MGYLAETEVAKSAPPQLTVLQVIANLDIGGAQEVVVTLAKALRAAGHRPVVCTLRDGPLRADLEDLGIPVVCLTGHRHSVVALPLFIHDMWGLRRELRDIVREFNVEVVQTHLLRAGDFVVATLRWVEPRPLVYWTFHNYNFQLRREHLQRYRWLLGPKRAVHRRLYLWGARFVSGLIAVSEEVRTSILQNIGPVDDRIVVVPNGVDVERYGQIADRSTLRRELGLAVDEVALATVATFKAQKGHVHLVDAVAQLATSHPNTRVLLIGDGELRGEIEARVDAAGATDVFRFLGSRRDVPELLAASDVFVLASLWEGLPMALLEGMATGLPCISTTVSGTQQVVVHGETGLLVPPANAAALRDAIVELLDRPEMAEAMGAAGRIRVEERYSAEAQARRLIDRFRSDTRCRDADDPAERTTGGTRDAH